MFLLKRFSFSSRKISRVNGIRFIPKYCDEKLAWYDRDYDFIDLNKWKEFHEDKDSYTSNIDITFFSKIYQDIGFRPKSGSLKKTLHFSEDELANFDVEIKKK